VYFNGTVAVQDLKCWEEIEHFHSIPQSRKITKDTLARLIEKNFLNKDYYLGPQSPAISKQQQLKVSTYWQYTYKFCVNGALKKKLINLYDISVHCILIESAAVRFASTSKYRFM